MRVLRFLVAALFAVALVPIAAGAANAAPPDNDVPTGATPIHLGDRVEEDTTQATTDASDATFNQECGAPETNASVWYTYTPSKSRDIVLDSTQSSYETGLMLFKGTPTADSLMDCEQGSIGDHVQAGTTYYIMAFSDNDVNGGDLVLTLLNAPIPRVHMKMSKHGLAFHDGAAKIHGTYTCFNGEFADIEGHIKQRAGRLKIQADSDTEARCDGQTHHWTMRLVSPVGTYVHGRVSARAMIFACGYVECRSHEVKHHVHLKWAKHSHHKSKPKATAARLQPKAQYTARAHWRGAGAARS